MPKPRDLLWERRAVGKDGALARRTHFTPQCWTWKGRQLVVRRGDRVMTPARLAFELAYGLLPLGSCVLRRCPDPRCIRPTHHRPANRRESIEHAKRVGCAGTGAASPRARLTPARVGVMRLFRAQGMSLGQIAREFGVPKSSIADAVHRRTWRHVE